jgi:hypothetical protein
LSPYLLALVLCCGIAVTPRSAAAQGWRTENFTREFRGTIGKSNRIRMKLTRRGNKLSATYSYERVGKPLTLQGAIDEHQWITLDEFDRDGKKTGSMSGELTSPGTIRGAWSRPDETDEKKTLSLYLESTGKGAGGAFHGGWSWAREHDTFLLDLTQTGSTLVGTYCATVRNAARVDCPSPVSGRVTGRTVTLAFTSNYSGKKGTATLRRQGRGLHWKVRKEPGGEFWAPREADLDHG